MSWLSGLAATVEPARAWPPRGPRLGRVAEREQAPGELVARRARPGRRTGPCPCRPRDAAPLRRRRPRRSGRSARCHGVEAERQRPVQHRRELDLLVAAQARVGRAAGGVLGDEVVDHVAPEPRGHVPDVERDAEHVRHPPGVAGVLDRAAAARAPRNVAGFWLQREVHADDVVPGLDHPCRGDRRVDPAATSRPGRASGVCRRSWPCVPWARWPARRPPAMPRGARRRRPRSRCVRG